LDGRDEDLGSRVELVRAEVLQDVEFRELPPVVRGYELIELLLGLSSQVPSIGEEKDALGFPEPAVNRSTRTPSLRLSLDRMESIQK
jgi:hypothetical protein